MSDSSLRAGSAVIDISPEKGIALCGYPRFNRKNTGINDPLYASCLILENNKDKILLINCDLVYFEKPYIEELREEIAAEIKIDKSNIMISCSHTHSGPFTKLSIFDFDKLAGWYIYSYPDYLMELKSKIVQIAKQADDNMEYAEIGIGEGSAGREQGIGGNRNDPVSGPADPTVGVIGIRDLKKKWMAVWVKYSLHPTILQADNLLVSADYPGYIRKYLKTFDKNAIMLFAQGATGDQSSRFFRKDQSFKEAQRFGYTIGEEVVEVLKSMKFSKNIKLSSRSIDFEPDLKEIPRVTDVEERIKELNTKLDDLKNDNASYEAVQSCFLDILGAQFNLWYSRNKEEGRVNPCLESEAPYEIQIIQIGNSCLIGIPGEIYVKYTLGIEANSLCDSTFVTTLTNGLGLGYIVTKDASEKGVFESGVAFTKNGTGKKLVEEALRGISESFKKE